MTGPAYTRLDVEERRRQFLELGAELFARLSYEELSMAKIARPAGISKALLYHYFPSKQAYFVATLEQAAAEERRAAEPDPTCPRSSSSTGASTATSADRENSASYEKLIQSAAAVPEVRELVERVRKQTAQRILAGHLARRAPPPCAPPSAAGCGSWTAHPRLDREPDI